MSAPHKAGDGPQSLAVESGESLQVFTGGIWCGVIAATWPFGRLRLDSARGERLVPGVRPRVSTVDAALG